MSAGDHRPLDPAELRRILQEVDPAGLLVPPRLLRRAIKDDRRMIGLGIKVPHHLSYVIGRDALLAIATRQELEVERGRELPSTLLLVASPEPDDVRNCSRGEILL